MSANAKQLVSDTVRRLPDDITLNQIAQEIDTLARLRQAEEASAEGRTKTHEEVRQLLHQWTALSPSKAIH